jgi:flagellar L-ring protein precursor FlgH
MGKFPFRNLLLATAALLSLSACNAFDRLSELGDQPKMASIQDPTQRNGYVPVKMPMPPSRSTIRR